MLPNLGDRFGKIITIISLNAFGNRLFTGFSASEELGQRHRLGAFESFGVIMGYCGGLFGDGQRLGFVAESESDRADAHRGTVSEAAVGLVIA